MMSLSELRQQVSLQRFANESDVILQLTDKTRLSPIVRKQAVDQAAEMVRLIRSDAQPGLMELFLAEYGLSTREGVALMCLAEAYLRTPDALSLDALIRDKIGPGDWGSHLGTAGSFLVNASTWALMLTGRMFKDRQSDELPMSEVMLETVARLGESLTQKAIKQAMKILGKQFVLGRDISEALKQSAKGSNSDYRYSFDMLGEAARTAADADKYFDAYVNAISAIAGQATSSEVHSNHGISVKLSALHPRYEYMQRHQIMGQLVQRVFTLAEQACIANIGFTIDAEEADRLELSLDVIEAVLSKPQLANWDGFAVVVQAYSKQAALVIEWLVQLAKKLDRRISVRLVKGAYWDYEIKQAQILGLQNYPVYTRKVLTDISYLNCAKQLLQATDVIYPQFATHNAHTTSAIIEMANSRQKFEFQRLHGMGEVLHRLLKQKHNMPCRVYAPVGVHKDLLAYLVRRLLENGANSSFVNKLLDENTAVEQLISDPEQTLQSLDCISNPGIPLPAELYGEQRLNSRGLDLNLPLHADALEQAIIPFQSTHWKAEPVIAGSQSYATASPVYSPSDITRKIGEVIEADENIIQLAFENAQSSFENWSACAVDKRAELLEKIAELYQKNQFELIALATLEAGKTRFDGIQEVRESIDFCRYYAAQARQQLTDNHSRGIGTVVCISPWNFPLAIFTGQIVAALVCGNPVLAKPAEQASLIAARAVELMYEAGIPKQVLQLIPGKGATVGKALTANKLIKAVCFTGSTFTASIIDKTLAANADPDCHLIAETGGLNTMIVDSTALLEQAVTDIVASAFQSAGQRCSALRVLCVQQEIEQSLLEMLAGAAQELVIGDPWNESTDVGPVIDKLARQKIIDHCDSMTNNGRLLFKVALPESLEQGYFVSPIAFRLDSLDELNEEIFGPVLHVISFKGNQLDQLIEDINSKGFGLTMGIHSRIDTRVQRICQAAKVGNIYVNRNQIGAVVGVQPFGGEGLSGTGPKAGGPNYLNRFYHADKNSQEQHVQLTEDKMVTDDAALARLKGSKNQFFCQHAWSEYSFRLPILGSLIATLPADLAEVAYTACLVDEGLSFSSTELVGPTGEKNQLSVHGRGTVLCLGGGSDPLKSLVIQIIRSLLLGNLVKIPVEIVELDLQKTFQDFINLHLIELLKSSESIEMQLQDVEICAVMSDTDNTTKTQYRQILAAREGARVALLPSFDGHEMLTIERVISTDTTASGGNASLLALGEGSAS